ncbi:hypothetical protein BKA57DRAFT_131195 [Linnemannia elongata]|nr:hypothetical protein BKA57DRAFT_131195 [Linnemannia elongata]
MIKPTKSLNHWHIGPYIRSYTNKQTKGTNRDINNNCPAAPLPSIPSFVQLAPPCLSICLFSSISRLLNLSSSKDREPRTMQSSLRFHCVLTVAPNPGSGFLPHAFHSDHHIASPTSAHTLTPLTFFFFFSVCLPVSLLKKTHSLRILTQLQTQPEVRPRKKGKRIGPYFLIQITALAFSFLGKQKGPPRSRAVNPPHPPSPRPSPSQLNILVCLFSHGPIRKKK